MKKIAVALVMIGSLSVAGQASAHGDGGDLVGAPPPAQDGYPQRQPDW